MIGKITKGSGFKGCVSYVLGKDKAQLLDSFGVLTESKQDIIKSFCTQSLLNPGIKKPVGHISLSYSAKDVVKLTDEKMMELAREYMQEMKITDTQYIVVRHHDREHPHVHIVFNRIDNNGKTVSDKNDRYRNEQICKQLKLKNGLYFGTGKENVKQDRLKEPDCVKYQIYHAVKDGLKLSSNWKKFQACLSKQGIEIRFKNKGQSDVIQGVSFAKDGYCFKGSELDRGFSFSKLDVILSKNDLCNQKERPLVKSEQVKPKPQSVQKGFDAGGLFNFPNSTYVDNDNERIRILKKKKKRGLTL